MNVIKTCALADQTKSNWKSIDWNRCEIEVQKLQARIVKAQKEGRYGKVNALQWTLTHSFYAKAMAVKRVTSNKGKYTAGVDRVLWSTPKAKMDAVVSLKRKGYQPQPLKRVNIKKSNGKLRPLGIPTMKDRAMQALYLLALDPIAETTADGHSYGFRKNRSLLDAREQCFSVLSKSASPKWIMEGDIKGCFDHINHDWLLANIPMDKTMLRKWLKCGFVFNKELFPTEEGTPQGGIISPTLANMTLNGLQPLLAEKCRLRRTVKEGYFNPMVNLIRYADDFIITSSNKETLEKEVKPIVEEFLKVRGLMLSEEKTKITHIDEGFDFLGFNARKYNGTLLIKPSKKSVKSILAKIRAVIEQNKAIRQDSLIRLLNPIIEGWCNHHKNAVAAKTFKTVDSQIFKKLWQWALRRHTKKGKGWIAKKYFHTVKNRVWTFGVEMKNGNKNFIYSLKRPINYKIVRYVKIDSKANPYDTEWRPYFEKRLTNRMLNHFIGRQFILRMWEKQKRCCPLCDKAITKETTWRITEKLVDDKKIKFLAHDRCCTIYNQNNIGV